MLPVLIVDFGLAAGCAGLVTVLHPIARLGVPTRGHALVLFGAGAALVAIGLFLPAPERRVEAPTSRLDRIVPRWQFYERHETRIRATPEAVERAIHEVTAREIRFFRLLTWIRNPRLPRGHEPESILAAPADEPLLAVALRSGFFELAREPERELVFGTLVIVPDSIRDLPRDELERRRKELSAERFATLDAPGFAKAAMNFRWTDGGDGWTRLTTETRIFATDAATRRRFAVYWRIIYPGSSLIRRTWLAAIRARAERAGGGELD